MNNGSRYRRNRRKKRIKATVIISVCVIAVLFVVFMVTGLILSKKTNNPNDPSTDTQANQTVTEETKKAPTVSAYPLALLEDGSSFTTRLSSIPDDARAVCVSLNTKQGDLLFRSSVSSHFSNLLVKADARQLSSYTTLIENNNLYCTALLYMSDFSNGTSEHITNVYSSIWGAIACDAIEGGINDILLIPNGTDENVDKLCALAKNIHLTNENAIVGLAIPRSILDDENSTQLINSLAKEFNYLAIDATEIVQSDELTPEEQIENSVKGLQLQIMYHNMRVILPKGADIEEQNSFIETLTKYNITNWQISPN